LVEEDKAVHEIINENLEYYQELKNNNEHVNKYIENFFFI